MKQDVRPERPDNEDVPKLSDGAWELAEKCWVKDPKSRPTASAVCDILSHLLAAITIAQPTPIHPTPDQEGLSQRLILSNLRMTGHTGTITCSTFSPDGKRIASGGEDRTIRIWDAQTGSPILEPLKMHTKSILCVAFSPDGSQIASGDQAFLVMLWDATSGQLVSKPLKGHTASIFSISFSPDGRQIASGSHDQTIRIWDIQTGASVELIGHTNQVHSVIFTADRKQIISGSLDGTVRIWDINSRRLVHAPLMDSNGGIHFVGLSPDEKVVVAGGVDGELCTWNRETGTLVSGPSQQHTQGSTAVKFVAMSRFSAVSPDGNWVVQNGAKDDMPGHLVQVWNTKTGQQVATLKTDCKLVQSVTFSPDSKYILFAADLTVHIHPISQ